MPPDPTTRTTADAARGPGAPPTGIRARIHEVVFEADTPLGKAFDVALLLLIVASLVVVNLESIDWIARDHGDVLRLLEWIFTGLFTAEYLLRCFTVLRPARYMASFFGLVDLLSILPTWLSLMFEGTQSLLVIRSLRLLRVFRVLKLVQFSGEAQVLARALQRARPKIVVFVGGVVCVVMISGAVMYFIEAPYNDQFASIPVATYWAIVTLTTVGYGDIAPQTAVGQAVSAVIMLLGYGIIAVPTGIVSAELVRPHPDSAASTVTCPACSLEGHDGDAAFCKGCGERLKT